MYKEKSFILAPSKPEDKEDIDLLVRDFFNLFSIPSGIKADLSAIYRLFIPEGIIIKNIGSAPEIYTLRQFIEPREQLFDSGVLKDFREEELLEKTDIFSNIAQRFCSYKKMGSLNGAFFETYGMKSMQFIRTQDGWRMSAVIWDDESIGK